MEIISEVIQSDNSPISNRYDRTEFFVVLPSYDWGVSDWHLDVIKPFVKRHKPIIGFSLKDARFASKVIVIGDEKLFPDDQLVALRQEGCQVDRITEIGTSIATILAERYP